MSETMNNEVLDDMLEVVVAYADQRMRNETGIELMTYALNNVDLRHELYEVVYGHRVRISFEDVLFQRMLNTLIAHAGTHDNDLYND